MGHIDMDKIRRHYTFRGRVQGVGFRYRASYAASMLCLEPSLVKPDMMILLRWRLRGCLRL